MEDLNTQAIQALKIVANPLIEYLEVGQNLFEQEPFFALYDDLMESQCVSPTLGEAIRENFQKINSFPGFCEYPGTDIARNWLYALSMKLIKTLPSEENDKEMHDYNYMLDRFDQQHAYKKYQNSVVYLSNKQLFETAAVEFLGFLTDSGIPFFFSYFDHAPIGGSRGHEYDDCGYVKVTHKPKLKPSPYITYPSWAGNYVKGLYIGTSELTNALKYKSPRDKTTLTRKSSV